ncbi:MAG TPA: alkaline phosphatase, partial [Bacillota bacterium]|nr:alkaline phosphatase [Bacillota bacterium]
DHETGGLSLGAGNGLNVDVSKLLKVRASAGRMAAEAASDWKRLKEILKTYANYELDDEDAARVRVSADPAKEIGRLISYASNVSWGSGSHTASMVIITAEGPAGACFSGWYDNTEFFLRMIQALGF